MACAAVGPDPGLEALEQARVLARRYAAAAGDPLRTLAEQDVRHRSRGFLCVVFAANALLAVAAGDVCMARDIARAYVDICGDGGASAI